MTLGKRLVTHLFVAQQDAEVLATRPPGVPAGSWVLQLLRADAHNPGVWTGPANHVAKAGALGRVVVSLRPEDAIAARRRAGALPLPAYLRGVVRSQPSEPSPPVEFQEVSMLKRNVEKQAPKGGATKVEVASRSEMTSAAFDRLMAKCRSPGAWPPTIAGLAPDAGLDLELKRAVAAMGPGEACRVILGADPSTGEIVGCDESEITPLLGWVVERARSHGTGKLRLEPHVAAIEPPTDASDQEEDDDVSWEDDDLDDDDADGDADDEEGGEDGDPDRVHILVVTISRRA